jgi:hypothetical protein
MLCLRDERAGKETWIAKRPFGRGCFNGGKSQAPPAGCILRHRFQDAVDQLKKIMPIKHLRSAFDLRAPFSAAIENGHRRFARCIAEIRVPMKPLEPVGHRGKHEITKPT